MHITTPFFTLRYFCPPGDFNVKVTKSFSGVKWSFCWRSKQIKVLIFIVLSFFIEICVAKSNIIQTIHLLALNYLLRVKVKNARKWFKWAFSVFCNFFHRVWYKIEKVIFGQYSSLFCNNCSLTFLLSWMIIHVYTKSFNLW